VRILWSLVWGILAGVILQAVAGQHAGAGAWINWLAVQVLEPFGQIFLRLLFFTVLPLVFGSLAMGVLQLGSFDKVGILAGRTFLLFFLNMSVAVALGLLAMNGFEPGRGLDFQTRDQILAEHGQSIPPPRLGGATAGFSLREMVEMLLPRNFLKAVTEFQVLPLIVFSLLTGLAGARLTEPFRIPLKQALAMLNALMVEMVRLAMKLAPWAVPAMICAAIVRFGAGFLGALAGFVAAVLAVMAVHLFGVISILVRFLAKRSARDFFRAIRTVMVTAFSTSSSSATLPTSLQVAREQLGVSATTAGFVLPLGATMNMSGTALYEGCVVLFVAQVYGVDLPLSQQLVLLLLSVLNAVAVAGIPGGSLPMIMALLVTFQIPAEGIALVLGVDRLLDMARTVLNVSADLATACIVDEAPKGSQDGL
jgi:DAACS family dicarboxylate/amino acid:cation (Na+ or H+) symporter